MGDLGFGFGEALGDDFAHHVVGYAGVGSFSGNGGDDYFRGMTEAGTGVAAAAFSTSGGVV